MRKLVGLALIFISLQTLHGEELKIITSDGYQGIANEEGNVIIPPIYQQLGWSDGSNQIIKSSIGYNENGKWGLINIESRKNTSAKYQILKPHDDQLFEAGIIGRFSNRIFKGLIDAKGRTVVDFKYFTLHRAHIGQVIISEYKNGALQYGVHNLKNERVIPTRYAFVEQVANHYLLTLGNGKKHLADQKGNLLLERAVDQIALQDDGYQLKHQGYYGKMDFNGNLKLPIQYKSISNEPTPFSLWQINNLKDEKSFEIRCDSLSIDTGHGVLIAHVNDAQHFLGASDLLLNDTDQTLQHIGNGFIVTKNTQTDLWSIFKTSGSPVLENVDQVIVDTDYFYFQEEGKWHVLNSFGRKINSRGYQQLSPSNDRNIPAKKNGYWGWVDFQGATLVPFKYDSIATDSELPHLFRAKIYGSWGLRSLSQQWVIKPSYDEIRQHSGFYFARKASNWSIFDQTGHLLGQAPFRLTFGEMVILEEDGRFGTVTQEGTMIYPTYQQVDQLANYYVLQDDPYALIVGADGTTIIDQKDQITEVIDFSEGYFYIMKDRKHGFIDENGKLRIANRYDSAAIYSEGLAPVMLLGRWAFIDAYENLVIQPLFDEASTFKDGRAVVKSRGKYGIIDPSGNYILQPEWKSIKRLSTSNYLVENQSGKLGLTDPLGNFLIRPAYDDLEDTSQSLIIVTLADKKGVLDYNGFTKVAIKYSQLEIKGDYLLSVE